MGLSLCYHWMAPPGRPHGIRSVFSRYSIAEASLLRLWVRGLQSSCWTTRGFWRVPQVHRGMQKGKTRGLVYSLGLILDRVFGRWSQGSDKILGFSFEIIEQWPFFLQYLWRGLKSLVLSLSENSWGSLDPSKLNSATQTGQQDFTSNHISIS